MSETHSLTHTHTIVLCRGIRCKMKRRIFSASSWYVNDDKVLHNQQTTCLQRAFLKVKWLFLSSFMVLALLWIFPSNAESEWDCSVLLDVYLKSHRLCMQMRFSHNFFSSTRVICYANHFLIRFYIWLVGALAMRLAHITFNVAPLSLHANYNCGRNLRKKFINKQIYANKQKRTKVRCRSPIICPGTSFEHNHFLRCFNTKHPIPCTNDAQRF